MNITVRTVAFLHLLTYSGIMWFGWRCYRVLPRDSWLFIGLGFFMLLVGRADRFITLLQYTEPEEPRATLVPFVGAALLLVGFWKMVHEQRAFTERIKAFIPSDAGDAGSQPVEFWFDNFRRIVREELDKTVTVVKKKPGN